MKLIIRNNNESEEYDGLIIKRDNRFYAKIEVMPNATLDQSISQIRGCCNEIGNVTLVNNLLISVTNKVESKKIIYEYEAGYCISGYVDEDELVVKELNLYFKELDYFFVKNKPKQNIKKISKKFEVSQKYDFESLFENDEFNIFYSKLASLSKDKYGHYIIKNPTIIKIVYKKDLKLKDIFNEIRKVENCFGFVINHKMNLIDISIIDEKQELYEVFTKSLKNYNNVIAEELSITDSTSKQILKKVLKKYYSNEYIASAINMFYEYIYNDLDNIFEFTSLVNTLELILSSPDYHDSVKNYAKRNNPEIRKNDSLMKKLIKKCDEDEQKRIGKFYKFGRAALSDKLKYTFYKCLKMQQNNKSDKYISKIVHSRNYYVHGVDEGSKNRLDSIEMILTDNLLKYVVYILIMNCITSSRNLFIQSIEEMISIVYESIINNIKNDDNI